MAEDKLISPHGSKSLRVLLLEGREKQEELKRAEELKNIQISQFNRQHTLQQQGLERNDSILASDHLVLVADFVFK